MAHRTDSAFPSRRELMIMAGGAITHALTGRLNGEGAETTTRQAGSADLIKSIERSVVWNGRSGGTSWFHPRGCMIPRGDLKPPIALITLQSITGSDVFGPVHWSVSGDLGKTWSEPQPILTLGRRRVRDVYEEGTCDVVPEYHPPTKTVLAIGHNVFYKEGALANPQLERHPVYVVRRDDGSFTPARALEWQDPRGSQIYTCGCGQRVTLPDGDLLVALSFAPKKQMARSVCSVRCSFDGQTLTIRESGNELTNPTKRGLLEPSLVSFDGRFYLTIRAEDSHGYVATSTDGLRWEPQRAWCWDDGEPLAMSTTQQHWLSHGHGLYLIYTRRSKENLDVMRWRAPVYLARVDTNSLRLIRSTERIVFPLIGDGIRDPKHVARMGNFHPWNATPEESWVMVGEERPEDGWKGDTLLARIRWSMPSAISV